MGHIEQVIILGAGASKKGIKNKMV